MRVKRPKLRVKRLFGGLNGREPRLEFGDAGLGNDDALRSFEHETQRKTAAEPHGDLLHGLPRDDELAVGPEEFGLGKQSLQRFEGLVQRVGRAVETVGRDLLVRRVAVGDPAAVQREVIYLLALSRASVFNVAPIISLCASRPSRQRGERNVSAFWIRLKSDVESVFSCRWCSTRR